MACVCFKNGYLAGILLFADSVHRQYARFGTQGDFAHFGRVFHILVEMLRVNLDFRQAHDTVGGHRLLDAHSRLLVQVQASADNLSGGHVGIGRKLEQHGFQSRIVEFPVSVEYIGSGVSVGNGADEVVEAFGFVDVHHIALHRQWRGVDYGRAVLSPMIFEYV